MQLLLLKYREDIIAAKVAQEQTLETLQSKILFLKDQVSSEQEEKTRIEEALTQEINTLQEKVGKFYLQKLLATAYYCASYCLTLLHSDRPKIVYNFGLCKCSKVKEDKEGINPFLTSGLVRPYCLGESICSFRVSGELFHFYYILHRNLCKQTELTLIRHHIL